MAGITFSGRWLLSTEMPADRLVRALSCVSSDRAGRTYFHDRAVHRAVVCILLLLPLLIFCSGIPSFAAEPSDREEDGLLGPVQSVETRESLLVQTDRYDPSGRLIDRIQAGLETTQGLWPLKFSYRYDQAGRRIAEVVQDARGDLVKETRSAYDDRGNRSAEVAAWGDGTFENVSLYEYDEARRRTRGLHYNGVQVINRNLYVFDGEGRVVRERFERNYYLDAARNQIVVSARFNVGYEVAIFYDEQRHVREKKVSDLRGRPQGRSEFRYDEQDNQNEERIFNAEGRITDRKIYRYEYDALGNWIKEELQWWEVTDGHETIKQSSVRERRISYY